MKGRKPDYPILLTLNGDEKSKCQNEELKSEGEFLVKQIHNGRSFVAYIEPEGEPVGNSILYVPVECTTWWDL